MKVIQFSKEGCPPCKFLKEMLSKYSNYKYVDVYNDELTENEQLIFDHMCNYLLFKSFPMMVVIEENNTKYLHKDLWNNIEKIKLKLEELESK